MKYRNLEKKRRTHNTQSNKENNYGARANVLVSEELKLLTIGKKMQAHK